MSDLPAPYFDRDGITIYHADCADILPLIEPSTVALLLTDPPYGIDHDTDYTRFASGITYRPIQGDTGPFDPTVLLRFPRLALFGANYYSSRLPEGRWLVWVKTIPGYTDDGPMSRAEVLWHNVNGRGQRPIEIFYHLWSGAYRASERTAYLHPTQKPVALMRSMVERLTDPGDLVLDPYMGSGPIAQACLETRRRYIGVEIDEAYCRVTVEHRLGQPTLPLGV